LADDRIPLLATVPLFGDLSARELTEVLGAGKDIEFPAGRMIVEEGSIGTDFYLILSGDATVSKGGRVIRRLRPGDFLGEISLLDGGPRSATVVAEGHVLAFRLNRPVMLRLLDRERSIARKVLLEVIKRLRSAERKAFY
jgi:CRP/FNR family cyclic AMP-dependent transcriptional regulator